jgi:hypothetical protein
MNILPESLTLSVTGSLTNTTAVQYMPSIYQLAGGAMVTSNMQWLLKDITAANTHESADTVMSVLGDDEAKWVMSLPAKQTVTKDFNPPLPMGEHNPVKLGFSAASTVNVSARFAQGYADGGVSESAAGYVAPTEDE